MRPRDPCHEPGSGVSRARGRAGGRLRACEDQGGADRWRERVVGPGASAARYRHHGVGRRAAHCGRAGGLHGVLLLPAGGHACVRPGERHPADHHRAAGLAPEHRTAAGYRGRACSNGYDRVQAGRPRPDLRGRVVLLWRGRARAERRDVHRTRRRGDGVGGAQWRRQVHRGQAGRAFLGRRRRAGARGRRGRGGCGTGDALGGLCRGVPGRGAVRRYGDGQHPARPGRRLRRRGSRRCPRRELRRVRFAHAAGLRYAHRRERKPSFGRRAPAHLHRPRHPEGCAYRAAG